MVEWLELLKLDFLTKQRFSLYKMGREGWCHITTLSFINLEEAFMYYSKVFGVSVWDSEKIGSALIFNESDPFDTNKLRVS